MESKEPLPRAQSMLSSISPDKFILIAGASRTEHFGDAWLLQVGAGNYKWVRLNTSIPPRSGHAGGGDAGRLYFFGGQNAHAEKLYNDVVVFDCASLSLAQENYESANVGKEIPVPRNSHTFCYDSSAKRLVLFGGASSVGELNDLFIYNIETKEWSRRTAKKDQEWPSAREMHVAHVYLHGTDPRLILIGGRINGGISSEVWEYEIGSNIWSRKKVAPTAIAACGSALVKNRHVILYGGTDGVGFLNKFWAYDIVEDKWKSVGPEKLVKDSSGKITSCLGVTEKCLVVYGGCGVEKEFGDVELIPLETLSKAFEITL